jgi:hypothetical protein
MFNNKFLKNDPLLEAVKGAQAEGAMRREAEKIVNEEFGVYSRKAVIREQLSAYDARLEQTYRDLKEGITIEPSEINPVPRKPEVGSGNVPHQTGSGKTINPKDNKEIAVESKKLAKKDYDKDGKIESPKDEVWGSRFRAAKLAGKMEEKKMWEAEDSADGLPPSAAAKQAAKQTSTPASTPAPTKSKDLSSTFSSARGATGMQEANLDEATRKHFRQHAADIAKISDQEERNKAATAAASTYARLNPRFKHDVFHKAAGSTAMQQSEPKKMDEAAYSAKSARAGKDIGKPGKMFSKIAKKAGEKYGSEERGKKVAGAILAKIRAKHMKEDQGF